MNESELMEWAIEHRRVDIIVEMKWGFKLSPKQAVLVRKIAFMESRKLSISAMTRWGKSQCVALGIALLIDFGIPAKIAFLGPKEEQAGILRQYVGDLIVSDPSLLSKAQITATGDARIGKEASKKRMTFTTGAEYRVFSGEGEADRLMGFGCDILIRDEACLINRKAYTKSSRMVGDNPENSIEIELYNPWRTDNKAYEHTLDPEWEVMHIGWEEAVKEGRTTRKFVEQQRKDLLPDEFTVLYESKFPEQADDSLFNLGWIKQAENTKYNFQEILNNLLTKLRALEKNRLQMSSGEYGVQKKGLIEKLKKFVKIVACDPAEKGLDETVMYWGIEYENRYQVVETYSEAKSDPMRVVGKMIDVATEFIEPEVQGLLEIDRIGIGSGPLSRLKEVVKEKGMKNIKVIGCHYGESAKDKDIYLNKKAEGYFRLAALFREGMIDIPESIKIRKQLMAERWERTSSNKKKIVDPDNNSPDWGDGLVYFTWKGNKSLVFGFG